MDFHALRNLLDDNNVEALKQLVTTTNTNEKDEDNEGIIMRLCRCFEYDDPDLLHLFIARGASLDAYGFYSPLHIATHNDKPMLVRALLDVGLFVLLNTHDYDKDTPLDCALRLQQSKRCARELVDAGAKPNNCTKLFLASEWLQTFIAKRENARTAAIIFLGLLRCNSGVLRSSKNGRDVLLIVARCIWSKRGE